MTNPNPTDTRVVYKSSHPDVLAHRDKDRVPADERWRDRINAFRDNIGCHGRILMSGNDRFRPAGFEFQGATVPDGWTWLRDGGALDGKAIVPNKGKRQGREAHEQLGRLTRPDPRHGYPAAPGSRDEMPVFVFDLSAPGFGMDAAMVYTPDAVYFAYARPLPFSERAKIGPTMWQKVDPAEYDQALEEAKTLAELGEIAETHQ